MEIPGGRRHGNAAQRNMVRRKVRLRFSKEGDLRHISHRDLMRTLERALRRAAIPLRMSEGFHPKPRMSFPLALGLGIVGTEEVMELELAEPMPPADLLERLSAEAPAGFRCRSVEVLDPPSKARVRAIEYQVAVPPPDRATLPGKIDRLLSRTEWIVRRKRSARVVATDLRPRLLDLSFDGCELQMRLSVTPEGTVRPEEVLDELELDELLRSGAVLRRTRVELEL